MPEVISGFAALVECQFWINKRCMNYGVPPNIGNFLLNLEAQGFINPGVDII